jgi:hypothetical protein
VFLLLAGVGIESLQQDHIEYCSIEDTNTLGMKCISFGSLLVVHFHCVCESCTALSMCALFHFCVTLFTLLQTIGTLAMKTFNSLSLGLMHLVLLPNAECRCLSFAECVSISNASASVRVLFYRACYL